MTRRGAVGLSVIACLLCGAGLILHAAPGTERLPWEDAEELLGAGAGLVFMVDPGARMAIPFGGSAPVMKEYILYSVSPIESEQVDELRALGIDVLSVSGSVAAVRGPLNVFSSLGRTGGGLYWVERLLPRLPLASSGQVSSPGAAFENQRALADCGALALQDAYRGAGILVGIMDYGFAAGLEDAIGAGRVHYVAMETVGGNPEAHVLVQGEPDPVSGEHGLLSALTVAAVTPEAEFLLFSVPGHPDEENLLRLIADGAEVIVDGRAFDLGDLDVLSNSVFYPVPADHNDGKGPLPQLIDSVAAAGVAYVGALGNFGSADDTSRCFFGARFADDGGDNAHDFDPAAASELDRNSLAVSFDEPAPDAGWGYPVAMTVVLEWDGWDYQLKSSPLGPWATEEIAEIQDLDLYVYTQVDPAPDVGQTLVSRGISDQYIALRRPECAPIDPVEMTTTTIPGPGTYYIEVVNSTEAAGLSGVTERPVDFHLYVYVDGGTCSVEHNTNEGSIINGVGARSGISVGAVEWSATSASWCREPYSSWGPTHDGRVKPDLSAPSHITVSTASATCYSCEGTSVAASIVAGLAALLLEAFPDATPEQLREAFCSSAAPLAGACNRAFGPRVCSSCATGQTCNFAVGCGMVNGFGAFQYLCEELREGESCLP